MYVACECLHGIPPSLCSALGLHFLVFGKMGHEVGMSVSPSPRPVPLCRGSLLPFAHDSKE